MDKYITWAEFKGYVVSTVLASSVLFGYGHHSTVDALIATAVWLFLAFVVLAVIIMTFTVFAIRKHEKRNAKELGKFYKAISDMHKSTWKRLFGMLFVGYWLYALIVQEWTVTAVIYFITVAYLQLFIFLTKDIAKEFFVSQLKGEGVTE